MSGDYTIIEALADDAENFRQAANISKAVFYAKVTMSRDMAFRLAEHCDMARMEIEDLLKRAKERKLEKTDLEITCQSLRAQVEELRATNARLKAEVEEGQMTALAMAAFMAGRLSQ